MTTEVNERTDNRIARIGIGAIVNHFEKRRSWIRCPRCIGGNMYRDYNGEHVCIQCGFNYNPHR
jgi:uncharacterized protein (DUF983 family)